MTAYKYFGLRENCFSPGPNPRYLYLTDQTNACLFKCKFVIDERQGLSLIVGKIGYGKTSMLRELVNGYIDNTDYKIAMLPNGSFPSEMQLAKAISDELGLPARRSLVAQTNEIRAHAMQVYSEGGNIILIIDEAQNLKGAQFDFLRSLLNFETNESKTIQIIIAGQPEIETKLATKQALVSRIILTNYLDTFTYEDMVSALEHRIRLANGKSVGTIISEDGLKALYVASRGVPREIIKIANAAMLLAAVNQTKPINEEIIKVAITNILSTERNGDEQQ
ncbi:MAG: ral secretion pathway protein [Blastocatellia bacterium]|jgi:type II secretory pathway predicted ATPase ExeA|nr:ral secretion pathway protein [Blastocatellia bacterium]